MSPSATALEIDRKKVEMKTESFNRQANEVNQDLHYYKGSPKYLPLMVIACVNGSNALAMDKSHNGTFAVLLG